MGQLRLSTVPYAIDSTVAVVSIADPDFPAKLLELRQERTAIIRCALTPRRVRIPADFLKYGDVLEAFLTLEFVCSALIPVNELVNHAFGASVPSVRKPITPSIAVFRSRAT